jgi:carbon starvation protein
MRIAKVFLWLAVASLVALAFGAIAWHRRESISAMWLVVAAVCTYALGYRFLFKASRR